MPERLTDVRARTAPAKNGKRTSYMDSVEPGLELRVDPDDRRVFALRRSVEGRDVRITLGVYPKLSLEAARAEAAATTEEGAAPAAAAEPEVMKKGKTDKEGDDKDKPKK